MGLHLLVIAFAILFPALAQAQAITGRVTDQNRRVLPGVTVTATADAEMRAGDLEESITVPFPPPLPGQGGAR